MLRPPAGTGLHSWAVTEAVVESDVEPGWAPSRRRTFLAFWLLYALFAWPGPTLDPVAVRHLALAEVYARGRLTFLPGEHLTGADLTVVPRADGTYVPLAGVGLSVLAAPLCLLVQAVDAPLDPTDPRAPGLPRRRFLEACLVLLLLAAPAGAASVVLLVRLLERVEVPRAHEVGVAVGLGLLFPLATSIGPHVVAAALWLAGLHLATLPRPAPHRAAAGFLVGAALLVDSSLILCVPLPIAAWVAWRDRRGAWPFFAGAAAAAGLLAARNAYYFGHALRSTAPLEHIASGIAGGGLFFGGGDTVAARLALEVLVGLRASLFVCVPVLLLALVGLPEAWRRRRDLTLLVVAVSLLGVLTTVGLGQAWYGGTSKGPRYLLPVTFALALPLGFALARWPRAGLALGGLGAAISWVQAQTPFYAEVRSSIEDVLAFGPRLRLVHSVAALVTDKDVTQLALLVSPLLAFPALALVVRLLAPPARRRAATAAVLSLWAGAALVALLAGPRIAVDRREVRVREVLRAVRVERYPSRLVWYGEELLGFGLPAESCAAHLRALELGGWRQDARDGLAEAVRALAASDPAAAMRVLGRAQALKPAAEAAPVISPGSR